MMRQIGLSLVIILLVSGCIFRRGQPPAQTTEPPPKRTVTPIPKPQPISPTSQSYIFDADYQKIAKEISEGEYFKAIDDLNEFIDRRTSPQPYVIEAQIIRFAILGGLRAGYLSLADTYYQGWKQVLETPDKSFTIEERTKRLTDLSKIFQLYYNKHHDMVVSLIKGYHHYEAFKENWSRERLRIALLPLKMPAFVPNPLLLERVKFGEWLETRLREEIEKAELHNWIITSLTALTGGKSLAEVNPQFARTPYQLNEKGFYAWLGETLRYQAAAVRDEAFSTEPELRTILQNKFEDINNTLKTLQQAEGPAKEPFKPEMFNPLNYQPP